MKIIDFCKNYDDTLWQNTLGIIKNSNDDLKNNYLTLNPDDFICWPVLVDDGKIVCFSGLQMNINRWGSHYARVNSRFYISPDHRHKSPGKLSNSKTFLNTRYLLPLQIIKAKELGLSGVFMTREGEHRHAFELYANLASRNTGCIFELLCDRYNVCGCIDPVPESCKQLVALHCFDHSQRIWFRDMEQHRL